MNTSRLFQTLVTAGNPDVHSFIAGTAVRRLGVLLVLVCGMLVDAAATTYLWVDDYEVTKSVTLTVGTSSKANITKGTITFDATTKTLTLDNAQVFANSVNAISLKTTGITVVVKGNCVLYTSNANGNALKLGEIKIYTTLKGYDSSAGLALTGGKNAAGLYVSYGCGCYIKDLSMAVTGKYGISGYNGASSEAVSISGASTIILLPTTQAVVNLAYFYLDSVGISAPQFGSFKKGTIVDHNNIPAVEVKIIPIVNYGLKVLGKEVSNFNYTTCDYTGTGTVKYNPSTKTLTFSDFTYSGYNGGTSLLENNEVDNLTIEFTGSNSFSSYTGSVNYKCIYLYKNTTIKGTGAFTVSGSTNGAGKDTEAILMSGDNVKLTLANTGNLYLYGSHGVSMGAASSNEKLEVTASGIVKMNELYIGGSNSEASFTGKGSYSISASDTSGDAVVIGGTASKLTIGSVANMSISGGSSSGEAIVLRGNNQSVSVGATTGLAISGNRLLYSRGSNCSLTFNKSEATLKGTNYFMQGNECDVSLTGCDVSSDLTYYSTANKSFYYSTGKLSKGTVQLKPVTAEYGIFFGDRKLNNVNCKAFFAEGMKAGSKVSYDDQLKTLTMSNVTMDWGSNKYPAFDNNSVSGLIIDLYGTNTFQNQSATYAAFRVRGTTTLRAGGTTGKLVVKNTKNNDNLLIANSTSLTVKNGATVESYGIVGDGNSTLKVENATVNLSGHNTATIQKLRSLTLSNAHIESPKGATYNTTKKQLLTSGGAVVTSAVSIVPGEAKRDADVNGDGQVDRADVAALMRYIGGRTTGITKAKADVNGDGRVTIADIIMVTQAVAGK